MFGGNEDKQMNKKMRKKHIFLETFSNRGGRVIREAATKV